MGAYLSAPVTDKVRRQWGCSWRCLCERALQVRMLQPHLNADSGHAARQDTSEGENEHFQYGVCAMQGWRTEMVRHVMYFW